MNEPLVLPISEKYRLDAELMEARQAASRAEHRATVAERKLQSFRADAQVLLIQMADKLTTANSRKEGALTLRALARRLELQVEIETGTPSGRR